MIKIEVIKANKSNKAIDTTTPVCNIATERIAESLTPLHKVFLVIDKFVVKAARMSLHNKHTKK